MHLFEDIQSEKDQSEIEPVENQTSTVMLYYSLKEKKELFSLVKTAAKDLITDPDQNNISDVLLTLLRKHYG